MIAYWEKKLTAARNNTAVERPLEEVALMKTTVTRLKRESKQHKDDAAAEKKEYNDRTGKGKPPLVWTICAH